MGKYIFEEVFESDLSGFFYGDGYSEAAGDYCYNVFPVLDDGRGYSYNYWSAINEEAFKDLTREMDNVINEADDLVNNWSYYKNIREIMLDYHLPYNSHNAHKIKEMIDNDDYIECLCDYLKIKTGKKWEAVSVRGYCQGDYTEVIYCTEFYTDHSAEVVGEMVLGCGKEYHFISLDDNGEEIEDVYGYYIADCEAWDDEDVKKILCGYEGLNPDDVELRTVDNYKTVTIPSYRIA